MGLYGTPVFNKALFKEAYLRHDQRVRSYFLNRPEDLLVLDLSQDNEWEPLCTFLGVDIPKEPFPHRNLTQGKRKRFLPVRLENWWMDTLSEIKR